MRLAAPSLLALAALAACATPIPGTRGVYDPGTARANAPAARGVSDLGAPVVEATASGDELAFVSNVLADLQFRSFANGREHCGYLGVDAQGRWMTSPISVGEEASCPLPSLPRGMRVVASLHTHSTYSPLYASEWPTTQDVATDRASNIDGYISTPGGRLWHVDTDTMTVRQLCGPGCLPQDPNYVSDEDGPLRPVMTYAMLQQWERSIGGSF
jgi:hypothetical protein